MLRSSEESDAFVVKASREMYLKAKSTDEAQQWVEAIQNSITGLSQCDIRGEEVERTAVTVELT